MELQYLRISLFTITICSLQYLVCSSSTSAEHVSHLKMEMIQSHLNRINKPPLRTILSPDGDIIDCIDETKQLAFDHPLLKDHKIQKAPAWPKELNRGRRVVGGHRRQGHHAPASTTMTQVWHQNGTSCPHGTIPVRRTTVEDMLGAAAAADDYQSIEQFGMKQPSQAIVLDPDQMKRRSHSQSNGVKHEYAIRYYRGPPQEIYGTKVTINLWDPYVQNDNEFSLSQLWIVGGGGDDTNTIEAGWQVYPRLYGGDTRPRLFIYWTRDGYQSTGCYNLRCSGFVQTNGNIVVEGVFAQSSSPGNVQLEFTLLAWKDPGTKNWWLAIGNQLIGYWPSALFTDLSQHADLVEWGGEIINNMVNGQHTATQMGSGHFAEEGFGHASYFRQIEVVDSNNYLLSARGAVQTLAETLCYDINAGYSRSDWASYFFYGGPGRNYKCP